MKKKYSIFHYKDYKEFLRETVGPSQTRRGLRGQIAKTLRCQPAYVSQILNARANLSLEQADTLCEFFGFNKDEQDYFLLLVQEARAGTRKLKKYFQDQLEVLRRRRMVLVERMGASNELSKDEQSIYYSSWHYAAVHMILTLPGYQRSVDISNSLGISLKRTAEVLEFLCSVGLAIKNGMEYSVGKSQIRLGNNSHNIIKHHTNWRNRAIQSLDEEVLMDLHYSAVVTLSKSDIFRIKDRVLEFVNDTLKTIRDSKEEELYCWNIDFFGINKTK